MNEHESTLNPIKSSFSHGFPMALLTISAAPISLRLPDRQRRAVWPRRQAAARLAAAPGQAGAGRGQGMRAPAHLAMEENPSPIFHQLY